MGSPRGELAPGPLCLRMQYEKVQTAEQINSAIIRAYREFAAFVASSNAALGVLPRYIVNDLGRIEAARDALAQRSAGKFWHESMATAGEYGLSPTDDKFLSIITRTSDDGPKDILLRTEILDNATEAKLLAHVAAVIDGLYKRSDSQTQVRFRNEKKKSRKRIADRTDKLTFEPGKPVVPVVMQIGELTLTITPTKPELPAPQ